MWPGFRENDQPCSKFIGGTRRELRLSLAHPLDHLSREQFVRAWSAVAYVFPGLHPDGCENVESGWPRALKRFAAEAWRRGDAGELPLRYFAANEICVHPPCARTVAAGLCSSVVKNKWLMFHQREAVGSEAEIFWRQAK